MKSLTTFCKKTLGAAAICALALLGVSACTKTIEVSSVTLSPSSVSIPVGETAALTVTVSPDDATDPTVTWTSSDPSVATVSHGTVTAVAVGNATITASAGSFSATCAVSVVKPTLVVTGAAEVMSYRSALIPATVYLSKAGKFTSFDAGVCLSTTSTTPGPKDIFISIEHDKDGNPDLSGSYKLFADGLKEGTTYNYRAYAVFDGEEYYGETLTFKTKALAISSEKMVDLGVSVKWANWNIGANKPEEYGNYYAWGETVPQADDSYSPGSYKYGNGSKVSRYCTDASKGSVDGRTTLSKADDAANVAWGDKWRMPTAGEKREMLAMTTHEKYTLNGVPGWLFTSKVNGNSIFLPATGYKTGKGVHLDHEQTSFWTSSVKENNNLLAYMATDRIIGDILDGAGFDMDWMSDAFNLSQVRYIGLPVRAVYGDEIPAEAYTVTTAAASDITPVSAKVSISVSPAASVTASGVLYQFGENVGFAASDAAITSDNTVLLKNLSPGQTYSAMGYAVIDGIKYYGNTVKFKTTESFTLQTSEATDVTNRSAVLHGKVKGYESAAANGSIVECGIAWRKSYSKTEHKLSDYSYLTYEKLTPDAEGNVSVTVNDLEDFTEYYYGTYVKVDGIGYYSDPEIFKTPDEPLDEWVDMGVSVLWRSWNVGATSPEQHGLGFAWGEIEAKEEYNGANYKWGSGSGMTKYNGTDGLKTLLPEDDAATQLVGGGARTPSAAEWAELLENVTIKMSAYNGEYVLRLTSKSDENKYIYMSYGYSCGCWSSSLCEYEGSAVGYYFYSEDSITKTNFYRAIGSTAASIGAHVRPVKAK